MIRSRLIGHKIYAIISDYQRNNRGALLTSILAMCQQAVLWRGVCTCLNVCACIHFIVEGSVSDTGCKTKIEDRPFCKVLDIFLSFANMNKALPWKQASKRKLEILDFFYKIHAYQVWSVMTSVHVTSITIGLINIAMICCVQNMYLKTSSAC